MNPLPVMGLFIQGVNFRFFLFLFFCFLSGLSYTAFGKYYILEFTFSPPKSEKKYSQAVSVTCYMSRLAVLRNSQRESNRLLVVNFDSLLWEEDSSLVLKTERRNPITVKLLLFFEEITKY